MNILEGYQRETEFAAEHDVTQRTVKRYRSEPNGLPWLKFGGKVYIHIEGGKQRLRRRLRVPNPTRSDPEKRKRQRELDVIKLRLAPPAPAPRKTTKREPARSR
jgi:hypothetical protein